MSRDAGSGGSCRGFPVRLRKPRHLGEEGFLLLLSDQAEARAGAMYPIMYPTRSGLGYTGFRVARGSPIFLGFLVISGRHGWGGRIPSTPITGLPNPPRPPEPGPFPGAKREARRDEKPGTAAEEGAGG